MAMVEAIEAFDGTREKFIGDAVFAVFGWPNGHDDDALRAAHCALAIREALARVAVSTSDEPLQVRIGLATGEVVAAPRGNPTGRLVADRPRGHDGGTNPDHRPARRDPPRRGDAAGDPQGVRGRGSRAAVAARSDPADPGRPTHRRGRIPAVAAAGRTARRPRAGAGAPARAARRRDAAARRCDRCRGRGRDGQVSALAELAAAAPSAGFAEYLGGQCLVRRPGAVSVRTRPRPGDRRRARHGLRLVGPSPAVYRRRPSGTGATLGRRRRRDRAEMPPSPAGRRRPRSFQASLPQVATAIRDMATRYMERLLEVSGPRVCLHRRPPLARRLECWDARRDRPHDAIQRRC